MCIRDRNGPKRAITCALNASLTHIISDLLNNIELILKEKKIKSKIMVVKGDGSLIDSKTARYRPIDTTMSGPAASCIGAAWLTGKKDAIIVDIGGTSTDISLLNSGYPEVSKQGARIGVWETMVEAISISTQGLGGDSEILFEEKNSILDINLERLRELDDILPKNVKTKFSNHYNIEKEIQNAHLVIGAVLIAGAKAPSLITRSMLRDLKKGTVLVDVAVDQGGCFETTKPTTHNSPTYIIDDVLHYSVANMPGAVPMTSTEALTNATVSYAIELANKGWKKACNENEPLRKGLNIVDGDIVYKAVADAFDPVSYTHLTLPTKA